MTKDNNKNMTEKDLDLLSAKIVARLVQLKELTI